MGQAILLLRCMYNNNYHDASDLAELEPIFRQVPITGQHISSHPPAAEPQHLG
jgi:hypothetical protein